MGAGKGDLLRLLLGAADYGSEVQANHVVMVPYPLQGHINPTMQLAKLLISQHATVRVTFVTNKYNHDRIQATRPTTAALPTSCMLAQQEATDSCRLQLVWLDNGLPPDFDYTDLASPSRLLEFHMATCSMKDPFKQLLQELSQSEAPASCVLFGSFCPWVHTIAAEFGIPSVFFWTQSATVFSIYYQVPLLDAHGFFPYNKKAPSGCLYSEANDQLVSYLPGVPPLHPTSFPTLLHIDSISDPSLPLLTEQFAILKNCSGVIINSFEWLEREAYQALQDKLPCPLLLVGPLIPSAFLDGGKDMNDTTFGASLLEEAKECIQWLDSQEVHSVLYVSFGSLFNFCTEDIDAIARAIKARKQPFLWVLRPTSSVQYLDDIVPKGFLEDTKGYGRIIPWAPQVEVLSHTSVGAFLTHCGWNSTIESVSMGVPMIPFPHFSDQPTNCAFVCDIWNIGMALKRQDDGRVKHEDVEALLTVLFDEEVGEEMRRRASKLREAAQRAALAHRTPPTFTQHER